MQPRKERLALASELTRKLEAVFGMIERERMHDIPILNPSLRVAAIGMRPFGERVGVRSRDALVHQPDAAAPDAGSRRSLEPRWHRHKGGA